MGLIFTCPDCGLSNAPFPAHHWNCAAITSQEVVTYSDAVAECDRLEKLLRDERAENEKLHGELFGLRVDARDILAWEISRKQKGRE